MSEQEMRHLFGELSKYRKNYRRGKKNQLHYVQNGINLVNKYTNRQPVMTNDDWDKLERRHKTWEVASFYNDWTSFLKQSKSKKTNYDTLLKEVNSFEHDLKGLLE